MPTDPAPRAAAVRLALTLLAVGLVWRFALAVFLVPAWEAAAGVGSTPDAYPLLARSLVEDRVLGYGDAGASPTTVRGPGFPLWLAPAVLVGGTDPRWMGVWGSIPGLLVGALVAGLAARWHGRAAGWAAGAVALLHPLPSLISARVMGDDFYAAVGAAGAIAWWMALRSERHAWRWSAIAGGLLGVLVLTRSSGVLVVAACVAFGLARRGRPRRLAVCAVLAAIALAPAAAWSVRTSRLEGRPVFVQSLLFYNFWIGEGLDRYGPGDGPGGHWGRVASETYARAGFAVGEKPRWYGTLEPWEAARLETALAAEAFERIRTEPLGYGRRVLRGTGRFWYQADSARRSAQYAAAILPILILAVAGCAVVVRRPAGDDGLGRLLLLALLLHNAAYAALLPSARMSVQVYPELAYLAGVGAAVCLKLVETGFRQR